MRIHYVRLQQIRPLYCRMSNPQQPFTKSLSTKQFFKLMGCFSLTNTSCYSLKSCVSMYGTSRKPAWPLDSSNARLWAQWFFKNIVFDCVLAHHLNIWEAFRFTFDVACSPRTQETTRPRTVKFQWQQPHNSVALQNKRSAWSVMDRNTNQTIIEARLNSWQRRWQRVLQHLSATNWLKTFVGDRLMQHDMNLVACKLFLANVHHPEKVYTVPLELMRKSLVPLKTCPLLQTNHINHQSWILHWFNPTKLGRDRFFFESKWLRF